MPLPLPVTYAPMEARLVDELPRGTEWQYEPKWDGFRCLVFRDGDRVELQSKSGQPLARYFPELQHAILQLKPRRFVLDGEIVIPSGRAYSFDQLLMRIHPAASRVARLAEETPARLLVFDLLVTERGRLLARLPLADRRTALEAFAAAHLKGHRMIRLSPKSRSVAMARKWLAGHTGTDGVMAKRLDLPYRSGDRTGMQKIKRIRTADCVVGGFRYASGGRGVGSLLLGLHGDDGLLHHVGFTSSFSADVRRDLVPVVERLKGAPGFTGRAPGGPSRWSTARSADWHPLRPELVVEVQYDHFTGGRFRHGTRLLRWRPDKLPAQCTMDQVEPAG
jgi:ATP-dependent DNA ligase